MDRKVMVGVKESGRETSNDNQLQNERVEVDRNVEVLVVDERSRNQYQRNWKLLIPTSYANLSQWSMKYSVTGPTNPIREGVVRFSNLHRRGQ